MTDEVHSGRSSDERELLFRYYEDQWNHVRHHETLRSSLTLQVLISAGAIVAAYVQLGSSQLDTTLANTLYAALSVLAMLIGIGGFVAVSRIERAAQSHIKRARAARQKIGMLDSIADEIRDFPDLRVLYLGFNVIVVLLGVTLLVAAVLNAIG